jgi:hypothetical protein
VRRSSQADEGSAVRENFVAHFVPFQ